MTNADECPTHIVSDFPADKDSFGSHERVARAVAGLVRAEPGGKTIGLQGDWGSGKSTVVNLLKQELGSDANFAVWVFDAWAHQGDPLRRTFLESLIAYLIGREWIHPKHWTARREELARRRKITETKNVPQLSGYSGLLIMLLYLVPLGYFLLSAATNENKAILYPLAALLLLAPLLVALWPYLRRAGRTDHKNDDTPLALFVAKTITDSRTETIENPDPTSVEFEDAFMELMKAALSDEKRRIILVLDNLDRVDPDDALSIWSTLQTFLQHGSHEKPDWFERMWLIVPHDPQAIRRLWDRGDSKSDLASSFLDKTFQVRFEVPPPVLSNWRAYLLELLGEALPHHKEEEFHTVYRVFALTRPVRDQAPTPRALKLYVNDIAALHRQRGDNFPLPHLAYYTVLRQDETDVVKNLREAKVPNSEMIGLLGHDVADSLAALVFNVDVRLARQLLLRDPVTGALGRREPDELGKLAESHPEGFWEILEDVVEQDETHLLSESTSLANAAACLAESGLLEQTTRPEARTVRNYLRQAAANIESWSPFNESMASGIVSLCGFLEPSPESIDPILQAVSRSSITGAGQDNPVPPETWADAVVVLIRGLKKRGLITDDRRVIVPANAEGWIGFAARVASQDPDRETWSFLSPQPSPEELSSAFEQAVPSGTFSQPHAASLGVTVAVLQGSSWASFVSAVSSRLQAPNALPGGEVDALLNALWELRAVEPSTDSALNALATGGHVLHHLYQAKAENATEGIASCVFTYLHAVPNAATPPAVGNSQPGHDALNAIFSSPESQPALAEAFAHLAVRYGDSGLPFTALDGVPRSKPFVVACLRILAQSEAAGQFFRPEVVVARWPLLANEFKDEELEGLVRRLANDTDLLGYVREQGFDPSAAGLYNVLITTGAPSEDFMQWCATGLGSVGKDQWLSQLKDEGELLELVLILQSRSVKLALGLEYRDALAEHGQLVVSGSAVPSRFQNWGELLKPLTKSPRAVFRMRLYDALIVANGAVSESLFTLYGKEISHELETQKRAPLRLFTPLLEKRNTAGLRWLTDLLDSTPRLLERFEPATVEDFKDRVRKEVAAPKGDDADEPIQRIAAALGIESEEGNMANK